MSEQRVSIECARTVADVRLTRLGWEGLEVDRVRREWEQIRAARPQPAGLPFTPDPRRWACVLDLLKESNDADR